MQTDTDVMDTTLDEATPQDAGQAAPPGGNPPGAAAARNARRRDAAPAGPRLDGSSRRPLAAVGLSEDEERAYRALLTLPDSTLPPIAHMLGYDHERTRMLLEALELDGLVTRSPGPVCSYMPAPPEVGITALIARRQQELADTHEALADLTRLARTGNGKSSAIHDPGPLIEIVSGREAAILQYEQMQREAAREVVGVERSPYLWADPDSDNQTELAALSRGIGYRAIYDHSVFDIPHKIDQIRRFVSAGERARVSSDVPIKLIAADRRTGLIPLDAADPNGDALLIRSSALLDLLYSLFEIMWDRAAPIMFTSSGRLKVRTAGLRASDRRDSASLVAMLSSGLKDEAIARQLELSSRTLDRRIAHLMRGLGAQTRFQAGWLARAAATD